MFSMFTILKIFRKSPTRNPLKTAADTAADNGRQKTLTFRRRLEQEKMLLYDVLSLFPNVSTSTGRHRHGIMQFR